MYRNRLLRVPTSPAKYGIVQEDVAILRRLNLTHIKKPHKAYTLFDFDNLEGSILKSKELRDYIGKFISKKMMYLMRSYGQDRSDLYDHMQHAALLALRKHYPFYHSDLHALNICKTSVHNSGVGIMEFWDRAKRKALMQDGTGYQAVKVPLESVVGVGVEPEHACEFRNNIKSLVSLSAKLKPKALAFVSAAAGLYDPGFSMFLGLDNTDAAEKWDYARYLTLLRTYYHVSEEQTTRLFAAIRKHLL